MNTPSHLVLSLAGLQNGAWRGCGWQIAIGAVFADLPMFGFYLYQRLVVGASERQLWTDLYFRAEWQLFFDAFNSIPIALLMGALAVWRAWQGAAAFAASWIIHLLVDLPLHNDDAHRHFLPMSSFRFESPVSYWDPAHYGAVGAGIEVIAVLVAAVFLVRRSKSIPVRAALALLVGLQTAGYVAFYILGRTPMP